MKSENKTTYRCEVCESCKCLKNKKNKVVPQKNKCNDAILKTGKSA